MFQRDTVKLSFAGAVIAALFAVNAQAAFIFVETQNPPGTAYTVPGINNFQGQLSAEGVSQYFLGTSLAVQGARAGDTIEIDFFAAEAAYWNTFSFGSVSFNNLGNRSWAERNMGTISAYNGLQYFQFCTINVLSCLTNGGNDTTTYGSFQSIGIALTNDGTSAWLLWDDSGARSDDNHDDLVLRLTYHSVPEPGTLALLGLGLVGVALFRRRKAIQA